jgi:hypothetical protein
MAPARASAEIDRKPGAVGGTAHGSVLSCGGAPRSDPISFPSSKPSPLYKHHHPAPPNHQFLHSQPPPLPTSKSQSLSEESVPKLPPCRPTAESTRVRIHLPLSALHLVVVLIGCSCIVDLFVVSMFPMLRSSCAPLENLSVFPMIC